MIEHRWHPRVPITIPVALHYKNGAYGRGFALDISAGGLFVKTAIKSWYGGCVDVRMTLTRSPQSYPLRLPSLVVRRSNSGIGLMFLDLDEQADRIVAELLRTNADSLYTRTPDADRSPDGPFIGHDDRISHAGKINLRSGNRQCP